MRLKQDMGVVEEMTSSTIKWLLLNFLVGSHKFAVFGQKVVAQILKFGQKSAKTEDMGIADEIALFVLQSSTCSTRNARARAYSYKNDPTNLRIGTEA